MEKTGPTLAANAWDEHEILGVEELFFLDLADSLPPVTGIIDLVLVGDDGCVVVDHKTCKTFVWQGSDQLALYAEHVRRSHRCEVRKAAFDAYRLVPSLKRARTPVFRRTRQYPGGVLVLTGTGTFKQDTG